MAKEQEQAVEQNAAFDEIAQLEAQLAQLTNIPQELKDKMLQQARETVSASAIQGILNGVQKLVSHDRFASARALLRDQKLSVTFTFGEDGSVADVSHRVTKISSGQTARQSAKSNSAKVYVVNGQEFETASEAARTFGVNYAGDSAVRALRRALAAKQIESFEVRDVESTETPAEENAEA